MSWFERRRALAFGLPALASSACGFKLRAPEPIAFERVALAGFQPRSPLAEELRRALARQARIVEAPAQAQVVVQAITDKRERSVVASTAAGQVREIQLRVRFGFRAHTPAGRELIAPVELLLKRDLSYSETNALAKELEEAQLVQEMQTDIVLLTVQRLATIRP
jgi:LPS-assembly lipoprotein